MEKKLWREMLRIRFCVLLILDAITLVITEDTNYASKYEFEKEDDRFDSRRERKQNINLYRYLQEKKIRLQNILD